ncbi:MAG: hypothetical protein Q9157_006125 [Trypethelium eluteriae]
MGLGLITASFCIVRTVLNYENVNQDSTWESIPNWYYRSWEVNIGIVAASVPAIYPGWKLLRSTVRSYISARRSQRGSGTASHKRLHDSPNVGANGKNVDEFEDKVHLASELTYPGMARDGDPLRVARHTASVEVGGATVAGVEERNLRGDLETGNGGIKKTTHFDVEGGRSNSDISGEGNVGKGERAGEEAHGFV